MKEIIHTITVILSAFIGVAVLEGLLITLLVYILYKLGKLDKVVLYLVSKYKD